MRMNWTYPLAEHVDFSYECAGNSLTDNYAWMEKNKYCTYADHL